MRPDGRTIVDQLAPEFPPQQANIAFGLSQAILDNALVEAGDPARWLVPDVGNGGDQLGKTWTETNFDDSDWSLGTNNIGFEKATGYEPLIGTDLLDNMTNSATAYVRAPFHLDSSDAVYSLTLSMKYDDGYAAYLNGVEVARKNAPVDLDWNADAARTRQDTLAIVFEDVDLTEHLGLLQNGENVLAIHALNANVSSNDFLMVPRLTALRVGEIKSLEHGYIQRPTPGGPNGDVIYAGLVADIEVDTAHGFYQEPLDVHIASSTPGASIIYTTDGSSPSVDNGIVVPPSGPDTNAAATLRIEETTTVRVAAFKDNLLPSTPETLSYIFLDDIASQDRQSMLDWATLNAGAHVLGLRIGPQCRGSQ